MRRLTMQLPEETIQRLYQLAGGQRRVSQYVEKLVNDAQTGRFLMHQKTSDLLASRLHMVEEHLQRAELQIADLLALRNKGSK